MFHKYCNSKNYILQVVVSFDFALLILINALKNEKDLQIKLKALYAFFQLRKNQKV